MMKRKGKSNKKSLSTYQMRFSCRRHIIHVYGFRAGEVSVVLLQYTLENDLDDNIITAATAISGFRVSKSSRQNCTRPGKSESFFSQSDVVFIWYSRGVYTAVTLSNNMYRYTFPFRKTNPVPMAFLLS